MAALSPIPVVLCGKLKGHQQATIEALKPEFESKATTHHVSSKLLTFFLVVIRVCASVEESHAIIASLLSPATETPTIDGTEYPRPSLVIMGGGYSQEEFMSIYDTVDGARSVPWVRPGYTKTGGALPSVPPPAEKIARMIREFVLGHLDDLRSGKGAGEVWWM